MTEPTKIIKIEVPVAKFRRSRKDWNGQCHEGYCDGEPRECEAPELCWPNNCCFREGTDKPLVARPTETVLMVPKSDLDSALSRIAKLEALESPDEPPAVDAGEKEDYQSAKSYAASLATALFNSLYAKEPDYASGKIVWGLCDSLSGILTQIDNMVSGLVKPAASASPATVAQTVAADQTCATCGATEPYTGTCGTSASDTKALCRRVVAAAEAPGTAEPKFYLAVQFSRADAECYLAILRLLGMEEEGDPLEEVERLVALAASPSSTPAAQPCHSQGCGGEGSEGVHGLDTAERVCFYEQDFYVLSNFSSFNLEWHGITFATSEAAYHWEKFASEDWNDPGCTVANDIMNAPSAHEAFKIAERNKALRRSDWDRVKVHVMRDILRAKVAQHEYVRRKLLDTGDRELVENSWRDDFWGWGPNRDGQNMLGKIWMAIRAELRAALSTTKSEGPAA